MNNAVKLAIAGILAASFSSPALAQAQVDGGVSAGSQESGAETGVQLGAGAGGAAATDTMNYDDVISSLRSGTDAMADISALDDTSTVRIVLLSELQGSSAENAEGLDMALSDQEQSVAELRGLIEANSALRTQLEAEGHTAEDVVAVSTDAAGEVILVVDGS